MRLFNRSKKMTEREQALKEVEQAQKHLAAAQKKLAEQEVTYSIGDRFTGEGAKQILAKFPDGGGVALIDMETGWSWASALKVESERRITQSEFRRIPTHGHFTRYWDARKKERC